MRLQIHGKGFNGTLLVPLKPTQTKIVCDFRRILRFSGDSNMSIEAVPRALIWRNDTSSSKRGRKVSHLRNVSTIHASPRRETTSRLMQSHHPSQIQLHHQLQYQLNRQHHCHLNCRQCNHADNDQRTLRRQCAAERRSTIGITKRNRGHDSKTNASLRLTSAHAEQSSKV